MVQISSSRDPKARRNFREAMNARNLEDLKLKVQLSSGYTQQGLMDFFFSMCDWGLNVIIEQGREKTPGKSMAQIMKEYYARMKNNRGRSRFNDKFQGCIQEGCEFI